MARATAVGDSHLRSPLRVLSQNLAAKNPIAVTLVFNHTIENIRANLIGLAPDRKKNYPLDERPRTVF